MKASLDNPIYTVYVVDGNTKYDLTPAVIDLDFSDQKKQLAQCVNINIMNTRAGGKWLSGALKVRQRVYIYADDGSKNDEVFRGFIWTRSYRSGLNDRELTLRCYDHLIYLQESEDAEFFADGKSSKDVMSTFCNKWGISLDYRYQSITHSKLALRGNLADIFMSDVLDLVKDRTGKRYVIRSEKDVMKVLTVGSNSTVYKFTAGQNAIHTKSECTMDGMITKVVILGKADKDDRQPVEATISGKTGEYGTLQKIINRSENTTLEDSKKEAQETINESGEPFWEFELKATDIPWIRKGDKVYVAAGDISNSYLIVASVDRAISNNEKTMTLTLEPEKNNIVAVTTGETAAATEQAEAEEKAEEETETKTTFTLTIKNTGYTSYWGNMTLYVNGQSRYSGKAKDLTLTLNYRDYVEIKPVNTINHSHTISDNSFNMKDNKTVTIHWTT